MYIVQTVPRRELKGVITKTNVPDMLLIIHVMQVAN